MQSSRFLMPGVLKVRITAYKIELHKNELVKSRQLEELRRQRKRLYARIR